MANLCGDTGFERMGGHRDCTREFGHHGAHESRAGRRWWTFPGHNHGTPAESEACAACNLDRETERARLAAGGALRPGQRMPADLALALGRS